VDVAERCRDQVAAALADTEHVGDFEQVVGGRVQLVAPVGRAGDPVFLAAHRAGLDLEHDAQLGAGGEQLGGDPQILCERER
jgi:hypothetical protein